MTVYVERDSGGAIKGVYQNPQPGYAEEAIDDQHPDVLAYLAPPSDAELTAATRLAATGYSTRRDGLIQLIRAVLLLTMDELNVLRARLRAQDNAIAAATSLADLKTRWAALNPVPDRTAAQIKPALLNRINTPDADA